MLSFLSVACLHWVHINFLFNSISVLFFNLKFQDSCLWIVSSMVQALIVNCCREWSQKKNLTSSVVFMIKCSHCSPIYCQILPTGSCITIRKMWSFTSCWLVAALVDQRSIHVRCGEKSFLFSDRRVAFVINMEGNGREGIVPTQSWLLLILVLQNYRKYIYLSIYILLCWSSASIRWCQVWCQS